MQAIILAGGKGTRLAERLGDRPKPLVDVCGVPLLERQIVALRAEGIDDLVLLVNHRADHIRAFCAANADFGLRIRIIDDGEPRGTAGALLACLDDLADRFLVIYGDTLFDIDIGKLVASHQTHCAEVTLFLHPNDHPADSDLVSLDPDGWIDGFHPYPRPDDEIWPNLVNAALYVAERAAFQRWKAFPSPSDLARDLFPAMIASGSRLFGYRSFEYIKDLGTPGRLDRVERDLRAGRPARARSDTKQRCVFIDRDGTLNQLRGHLARAEQLEVFDGAGAALARLNRNDYRVAVITNQPVLARGECSEVEMARIHAALETRLGRDGGFVDGIWLCPHHPDNGFAGEVKALKRTCNCRKPAIGLIEASAKSLNADLTQSWMIGDSTADIVAGQHAGLGTILLHTGEAGHDGKFVTHPDFIAEDVSAAVALLLERLPAWLAWASKINGPLDPSSVVRCDSSEPETELLMAGALAVCWRRRGLGAIVIREPATIFAPAANCLRVTTGTAARALSPEALGSVHPVSALDPVPLFVPIP